MTWNTAQQMAEKWGVSLRYVQVLCQKGRIEGAQRIGRDWQIPCDAVRPADSRIKKAAEGTQSTGRLPRKTPFLYMTDLYKTPGSAEESGYALKDQPEAQTLFAAEVAYSQGQIDKVYEHANYLLSQNTGLYAVLSAGMLLALCAIWKGDLSMWRRAKLHIAEAPAKTDEERDIMSLSLTAVDSMLYDVSSFPEWFKIGCFETLPKDALPAVKVFYAKYLYAVAYAVATRELAVDGLQGLSLMSTLPYTIEPMISQAMADDSLIAELYLRMTCAVIYRNVGNEAQAYRHIHRALTLALPDKLYGLLAEYCRTLGPLLQNALEQRAPEAWTEVKQLYKIYNDGWTHLSGTVRGKSLATTLSQREREVAKLAAFGMQNSEIAQKLNMSLSGVKQAIRIVSEKTGMSREEFAAVL